MQYISIDQLILFLIGIVIGSIFDMYCYQGLIQCGNQTGASLASWYSNYNIFILSKVPFGKSLLLFIKERVLFFPICEILFGFTFFFLSYQNNCPFYILAIVVLTGILFAETIINIIALPCIIPDELTLPNIILGLILSIPNEKLTFYSSLVGLFSGSFILLAIGWIGSVFMKKDAMGGGNIKLQAVIGAFLGPIGSIFSIILAGLTGSVYGIYLMMTKRINSSHEIPFGIFQAIGVFFWIFAGETIINFYFTFIHTISGK